MDKLKSKIRTILKNFRGEEWRLNNDASDTDECIDNRLHKAVDNIMEVVGH